MLNFITLQLSHTKCFLIKANLGYLLIDCGNAYDKEAFEEQLLNHKIAVTDIQYLFLTHHHSDHCGLLSFLKEQNPGLKVIMSKKCAEFLKLGSNQVHPNEHYCNPRLGNMIQIYRSKSEQNPLRIFTPYFYRDSDIIIETDDNAVLPSIGITGSIIMTPGHTEDSISLITKETAFVGDALRNNLNFTGTKYQPILLYSPEECKKSLQKLISTGVEMIYPAHGKAFPADKLAQEQ